MPGPNRIIGAGPALDVAVAVAVGALERAGVEVPRYGERANLSALVRVALLAVALSPQETLVDAAKEAAPVQPARGTKTLLTGGLVLERAIESAVSAFGRAGVELPLHREEVNITGLVRLALVVAGQAPPKVLRHATDVLVRQERDEALLKLFDGSADAQALTRARAALGRHGVDSQEIGRVLRLALLVAARASDAQLQEAVSEESSATE
jgi:hypothetical protein